MKQVHKFAFKPERRALKAEERRAEREQHGGQPVERT